MSMWKKIVGTVAPTLATALTGGNVAAGAAVKAISKALLGKDSVPEAELAEAVVNATPEQLEKLKAEDYAFRIRMKELGIDLEKTEIIADAEVHKAQLAQDDTYTKRTRPYIARTSMHFGMGYIAVTTLSAVLESVSWISEIAADTAVLLAILSPALAYAGVRSLDKWRLPQPTE